MTVSQVRKALEAVEAVPEVVVIVTGGRYAIPIMVLAVAEAVAEDVEVKTAPAAREEEVPSAFSS